MRYIKTYEDMQNEYKKDDYVLLDLKQIEEENKLYGQSAQIPYDDRGKIISFDDDDEYPYRIKFYNNETFSTKDDEIIRLLTPEEIEEYEMKNNSNKYNL